MNLPNNNSNPRLLSLDALRGFDMIWILGAEGIFAALFGISQWPFFESLSKQFEHSEWHGLTFYDLIFPLFIFLSGVTIGMSNKTLIGKPFSEGKTSYIKSFKRLLILCLLGIVYNHGWGQGIPLEFDQIRYVSVLMRIGLAWFFCAMIVWHFELRSQLIIALILLVGYWVLLQFIPTPDGLAGYLTMEHSWNAWIDQRFLPGLSYRNLSTDPEGLLSQIPAVVNALGGAFAGRFLALQTKTQKDKVIGLILAGFICLSIGFLWAQILPLNKTLWTSSFTLVCIGFSSVLLAVFYLIFDVLNYQRMGLFFAVIGANSILLYLLTSLFNWQYFSNSLFSQGLSFFDFEYRLLLSTILLVMIQWLAAKALYNRQIFVRV